MNEPDPSLVHAENCWSWGPKHYACALRKIRPRQSLTDAQCDEAIRRSGLWPLACTVPQNLALLRGLCRAALEVEKGA